MEDESNKIINEIIISYDWEEVLNYIVFSENMDPLNIDLIKLTNAFMSYLQHLKDFDFRIPGRFILIAAILLRMKMELLLEKEEKKERKRIEEAPKIDISNIKLLEPPMARKPTRTLTLHDLVSSLKKTITFKERKYEKKVLMKRKVKNLIGTPAETIEMKMEKIYRKIVDLGGQRIKFSSLVNPWTRKEIVDKFLPLLHLSFAGKVDCDQPEMFGEIYISVKEI